MAVDLAEKKCVPCRGGVPPLTADEIKPLLALLNGWQVEDNKRLIRSYPFKNFVQAMDFAYKAILPIAEEEAHHPDLYVRWGEVRVYLWTHKIDGLTESDFILAAKIERARENWMPEQAP